VRIFTLARKPADYTADRLFADLVALPESWHWDRAQLIEIRLCPVALRLAKQANWPLIRQCWRQAHGVHPLSEVRLEPIPCPS